VINGVGNPGAIIVHSYAILKAQKLR